MYFMNDSMPRLGITLESLLLITQTQCLVLNLDSQLCFIPKSLLKLLATLPLNHSEPSSILMLAMVIGHLF